MIIFLMAIGGLLGLAVLAILPEGEVAILLGAILVILMRISWQLDELKEQNNLNTPQTNHNMTNNEQEM